MVRRQAHYNGASGVRGIHSFQKHGKYKPEFNNNAYTLTSIYHNDQLQMLATSDRPEYYMTQLNGWSMTANANLFWKGATWYWNDRDWAKEQRDNAVKDAN